MGIRSELHEAIVKRGGKVPVNGGIAAALDVLNKLPSGGVSSWNDLTDKPVEYVGDTFLTWDHYNENKDQYVSVNVDSGENFYKISDAVPTKEELLRGKVSFNSDGLGPTYDKPIADREDIDIGNGCYYYSNAFIVIPTDNFTPSPSYLSYTFPEKGIYAYDGWQWLTKLEIPDYTGFQELKLKKELLPQAETVADATETPTAEQFNALLASLRNAGYLAT